MNRANITCHNEFNRGLKQRKAHPLHRGDYKLNEVLTRLARVKETIAAVATDVRRGGHGYGRPFGACTSDDAAVWLKHLPEQIAFDLGYYIIPAIEALGGDGVPKSVVNQCNSIARSEVSAIVEQCEYARNRLRLGIKPEYRLMKAGDSTIQPLIDAVIDLIDDTYARAGIKL